ncbi:hypothetical protein BZA05DRAFT_401733 [Tricharina praecox]|uniref:uncharacterized protein n=1 Tax=Tricharina praecox TaxID=43433 RepID=UPI00221E975E|nr:uncharacterized protein BZA05DRAFT_401733 [Tricharina praecox]KAI5849850.1 hypothetical protein BZA05DRAFT_401733 [Tricharina praecox]
MTWHREYGNYGSGSPLSFHSTPGFFLFSVLFLPSGTYAARTTGRVRYIHDARPPSVAHPASTLTLYLWCGLPIQLRGFVFRVSGFGAVDRRRVVPLEYCRVHCRALPQARSAWAEEAFCFRARVPGSTAWPAWLARWLGWLAGGGPGAGDRNTSYILYMHCRYSWTMRGSRWDSGIRR